MADTNLRALLERFRAHGDADALGLAFDASAPELLRIARHLAHDRDEADDIVQATYLTAVEKIASLERGREPLPWLIGMLVLHAREARRRRGRPAELAADASDVDALATRRAEAPDAASERRELSQLVERAVAELPEHYRAVVAPYLDGSASSHEIAQRVGRSPGVVRMQIHRALERLRRALPAGAALGFFGFDRELAALRERVVARALARQGGAKVALTVGGSIVLTKIAWWLAALVLAALGTWWLANSSAAPARVDERVARAADVRDEPSATPTPAVNAQSDAEQRLAAATSPSSVAAAPPADALAVTGRLLAHDATPMTGIEVSLLELTNEWMTGPLLAEPYAPFEPVISTARTDASGAFRLGCARRGGAVHVLGIDLGGPRGCGRVIDAPLAPGVGADIGDVVLSPSGSFAGRAIDEHGAPLADVTVLAAVLPAQMQAGPMEYISRCTALGRDVRGALGLMEIPSWLRALIQRLPVATVRTGADGRFEVATSPGLPAVVLDCPGRPGLRLKPVPVSVDQRREIGDVVIAAGRSAKARVVDADGTRVRGARVLVGVIGQGEFPMFAMRASAGDGEFEFDGLPPLDGELAFAAQRGPGQCWKMLRSDDSEVELRLDAAATLSVDVVGDDARALSEVEIELMPALEGARNMALFARGCARSYRGAGLAMFDGLAPGSYALLVRAKGFAPQWSNVDVTAPATTTRVALAAASELAVRVHDASTSAPIAGARLYLRTQQRMETIDCATTGDDGVARLRWMPVEDAKGFALRVEHPSYAPRPAQPVQVNARTADVALDLGGTLAVHVRERGAAPAKRYTLSLINSVGQEAALQIALDARGDATVARLSVGSRGYELREGVNDRDALQEFARGADEPAVRDGSLVIKAGEPTELALELDKNLGASGSKARLRGRIVLYGDPAKQATIYATQLETNEHVVTKVDQEGSFDFGWIAPGAWVVTAQQTAFLRDEDLGLSLFRDRIELQPGEERSLDLDLDKRALVVHVTDRSGQPVANASAVLLNAHGQEVSDGIPVTGADGLARVATMQRGIHQLVCSQPDAGVAVIDDVFAVAGAKETLEVVLDPGVPCEGWLELPPDFAPPGKNVSIDVYPEQGRTWLCSRELDAKALRELVSLAGLQPGRYYVRATCGTKATKAALFELAPGGKRDFVWRLEASDK